MDESKKNTHHPYAKLFEYVFQKSEMVEEFIKNFFPTSLSNNLKISTLKPQSVSYLSPELSRLYSDIVYTCDYGEEENEVLITLLFEHKSYLSQHPHLQLLGYMLKIWEQQRDNSEATTPVIPVVLYHGDDKWKKRKFTDMFTGNIGNDLQPYIPSFDLHLVDLNEESDEKLKSLKKRFLTNSLLTFKYHKNQAYIRQHFSFLIEVGNDVYQHTMLVFLIKNYDISEAEIPKLLENTSNESKSKVMNVIDAYYADGKIEGEAKGLHNKSVQAIRRLIKKEMPISFIAEVQGETEEFVKGVISGDITEIG